ncbi:GTPase [Aureococcus anophagefferens]|nr:GTPase [Aureococcus anophagefferens]
MPAQPTRTRECKVVLLGDTGVGKSSLAQRYVTNTFKPYSESTIGASFMSKMILVDGAPCKCQIWDTAGQEKYHSLAPMYYRGAAAAILVFDITKPASLDKLKAWADLADRRVPADDAKAFAADIGALYCETSAKDDTNVSQLFADLVRRAPAGGAARTDDAFDLGHDAAPRRGCCRG